MPTKRDEAIGGLGDKLEGKVEQAIDEAKEAWADVRRNEA